MLSSITVNNFECFDEQNYKIDFSKLNMIVGPNNSGKSAIFKALNLVRYYAVNPVIDPPYWNTDYYNLQDFPMAVYNHDISRKMSILVEFGINGGNLQSLFGYQKNNYVDLSNIGTSEHVNLASKVWYISSNRGVIPFRLQVGSIEADKLQPIKPNCENIVQYLLERYNARDKNWSEFETWMTKIDPQIKLFRTSLKNIYSSLETDRDDGKNTTDVNLSLQGSGIQSIISIVAALIFSPKGHTIIIEEPENFLHRRSIGILINLFNHAINKLNKQVIITTHSWDILFEYMFDVNGFTGQGKSNLKNSRGPDYEIIKPEDLKVITFNNETGTNKIQDYDLVGKEIGEVNKYFSELWGY